jgi:hypothetical protein
MQRGPRPEWREGSLRGIKGRSSPALSKRQRVEWVVGRGSVRTGVSRPPLGQGVNPHKRTAAKCGGQKTLAEPITEYRTINEPLVPFTTAGHLRGFMRFPRSAGKPRFGGSLSLATSFALCSKLSSSSSFSFSFSIRSGLPHRLLALYTGNLRREGGSHEEEDIRGLPVVGERHAPPGSDGASSYHRSSLHSSKIREVYLVYRILA